MNVKLTDLNHRILLDKMREDLRALERNMDILYASGSAQTVRYTGAIVKLAEDIEKVTEGSYGQANHEIIMGNETKSEPMKSTSASEIFARYS